MKDGTCPKCGGTDVRTARDQFAWVPNEWGPRVKTSKFTANTPTDTYVCTACGYFEHYIADSGKLAEVAQAWAPVGG